MLLKIDIPKFLSKPGYGLPLKTSKLIFFRICRPFTPSRHFVGFVKNSRETKLSGELIFYRPVGNWRFFCPQQRFFSMGSNEATRGPESVQIWQGPGRPIILGKLFEPQRRLVCDADGANAVYDELSSLVPGLTIAHMPEGGSALEWPADAVPRVREYLARSIPPPEAAAAAAAATSRSTGGAASDAGGGGGGGGGGKEYEYYGAFALGVKRVKVLSLASLFITTLGGPLLVLGNEMPAIAQYTLAGAVVAFGVSTTGLLHFFTRPYVLRLRRAPGGPPGCFEMETPSITGGTKHHAFTRDEVEASGGSFTTFTLRGRGGFYLHRELFEDTAEGRALLSELLGPHQPGGKPSA